MDLDSLSFLDNNNNNMPNIQCSSVDLLEILATHFYAPLAQANGDSSNTTRVQAFYALLLSSNFPRR